MKKLLLSPYAQKMRSGLENPKNFPFWDDVVKLLKEHGWFVTQIGINGEKEIADVDEFLLNLRFKDLEEMIGNYDAWASVDNFFPHFASYTDRRGVVIWGKSDPDHFGYPENVNLLKSRNFLREKPWDIWEAEVFSSDVFISPEEVVTAIESIVQ